VNGGEEVNYSGCQDGSRSTTRPLVTWAVVPVATVTVWMWKGRPSSWSPPRAKPIRAPSGDQAGWTSLKAVGPPPKVRWVRALPLGATVKTRLPSPGRNR